MKKFTTFVAILGLINLAMAGGYAYKIVKMNEQARHSQPDVTKYGAAEDVRGFWSWYGRPEGIFEFNSHFLTIKNWSRVAVVPLDHVTILPGTNGDKMGGVTMRGFSFKASTNPELEVIFKVEIGFPTDEMREEFERQLKEALPVDHSKDPI